MPPNKAENLTKSENIEVWYNMSSSTWNVSSKNPSVVTDSQTVHTSPLSNCPLQPTLNQSTPAHSYITGIYHNNFNINISFKPLYFLFLLYPLSSAKFILCISSLLLVFHVPPWLIILDQIRVIILIKGKDN